MYKLITTLYLSKEPDGMNMSIRCALRVLLVALVGVMAGCARTSTLPLAANRIEVTVRVAPVCSRTDADRLALQQAAVETIKRGFEDFIVINTDGGDHIAGYTPMTARTTLFGNSATTSFSGGAPRVAHHRVLTVQMLHAGQLTSEALSARAVLGSDWKALVMKGAPATCLGGNG